MGNQPIFRWIDGFSEKEDVVTSMSPNRYAAWNFLPTLSSSGSIEFRRPSQVATSNEGVLRDVLASSTLAVRNPGVSEEW